MAVDAALENLRLSGVNPVMINAGGDLISTWLRPRIGYIWWRRLHVLTLAIYALVTVHGIGTGSDTRIWWGLSIYLVSVVLVGLLLCRRLLAPANKRKHAPSRRAEAALLGSSRTLEDVGVYESSYSVEFLV